MANERSGNKGTFIGEYLSMKAAMLVGPKRIRVMDVPRPVPGRGEVLVRVRAVGICRSDLHYYLYGRIGSQVIRRYPQLLGHEPSGEVAALGPGARGLKVGDRVAVEPAAPCGKCGECRKGRGNICSHVDFLGMPGLKGAFSEYLVMRPENLFRVPRSVSFEVAAALEPFSIGLHAVKLVRGYPMKKAAVVGVGPVGLSVLAALKVKPVHVTACDIVPARLRVAKRMKADKVVRVVPRKGVSWNAKRLPGDLDVVFEAGGTPEAMNIALEAVRPGGVVALIGITDDPVVGLHLHIARRKELVIINVRRSNGEIEDAVRLVASGRVNLKPMLTHRGGLEATARFFRLVSGYRKGIVKAVVLP